MFDEICFFKHYFNLFLTESLVFCHYCKWRSCFLLTIFTRMLGAWVLNHLMSEFITFNCRLSYYGYQLPYMAQPKINWSGCSIFMMLMVMGIFQGTTWLWSWPLFIIWWDRRPFQMKVTQFKNRFYGFLRYGWGCVEDILCSVKTWVFCNGQLHFMQTAIFVQLTPYWIKYFNSYVNSRSDILQSFLLLSSTYFSHRFLIKATMVMSQSMVSSEIVKMYDLHAF